MSRVVEVADCCGSRGAVDLGLAAPAWLMKLADGISGGHLTGLLEGVGAIPSLDTSHHQRGLLGDADTRGGRILGRQTGG
jgi:hypothetical protein